MSIDPTAGNVAADMERIFKPLAGRALVTAFHHDRDAVLPRGRAPGGWRRVTLAAPAAVLLVTAALAIGYGRVNRPDARMVEAAVVAPSSAASSAVPPPAALLPAALPPIAESSAPAPTPSASAPTTPVDVAAVTSRPAVDPRPAADPASAVSGPPEPTPAAARPSPRAPSLRAVAAVAVPRRPARVDPAPATPRCTPDSLDDRCIYQDVLNADLKLRLAYDDAKRSGVSKLFLSAVASRWNRARKDADYSPDETIRRYERLAEALDAERRDIAR